MGEFFVEAIFGMIVSAVIVTALVVGGVTFAVTWYFSQPPSEAQVLKEGQRQQVIEKLTPEERELLGV